jgi:hypothetical protein
MSISFAATPQAKEGQQARAYVDDASAGAPPSRRTGYDRPYVDRDHWNKVFTQPEYFDGIAKQKGMIEGSKVSLHGDDYVYRQAMMGYLSATRNVPLDDMRAVFDAEKDGFAQKVLGKKTATARELFDWHKTKFERENEKSDAARTVIEDVTRNSLQDAMMGGDTPFVESVTKSIEATGDLFTEEEKSRLWEKAEEQDKQIRASQAKFAPESRFLFSALGQTTGQQAGMGAPDMREMAGKFAQLPDNQRKAIYELVGGFAQLQQTDKGFWYQMAESLGRGASDIVERVPRNFREQTLRGQLRLLESEQPVFRATGVAGAEFSAAGNAPVFGATQGQMVTPEEREQAKAKIQSDLGILKVERELRDLAERVVDPIKTVSFLPEIVEEGLYGAARSLPYTAVAAIPFAGIPAVASALFSSNYDRIMLEYPDLDPDKAALIAAISAPIEAGLERMKVNTITGRLPVFGGLVKRLQHPNQRNITRIAIGGAGIVAEQNVQEIVQNATFPFIQTVAAALDQDMPDYDWAKRIEGMPRELAVQFVALLPLSLIGMGALSHREMTRGADYIRNKSNLERMGYSEDQINLITGAATADEAQSILQEESGKRDPEAVKAAAKRVLDEVLALREQKAPASLPRLEKQGADYVVLSPEGKELARSTDQTVAEQALVSARRETVQREMRDVHTGINEAVEFIQKVNEARQRGEDIAEVIREQSPRTLLTDYEANPTQENLDRLFETVRAFGKDINEPAELANFPVIGSNQGALAEGIWRSVIRINEGADGAIVMREFAQDNLKRAISEGRTTMDFVRQQLNDILPQIDSARMERQLRTETDTDVIEAFSDIAVAYFRGSIREEQIPAGLRGIMRRLAIISRDIFRRAYNLARLRAEGKLDRDFEALLAEAVGVDQQALVDRARERTEQDMRGEDGLTDVERRALQIALQEDMEQDAFDALRENGTDILDAVREAGGLPSAKSSKVYQYAGELKRIREAQKGGNAIGVKATFNLFRKDAPDLDALIKDLQSYGFNQIETPSDLFDMIERRMSTGRPIYGYEAASMAALVENYSIGSPAFQAWFADSKVVDAQGNPLVVFHGTRRPDRVGNRFRKARATSGPMAFFTATADIASSYAEGKTDTSLEVPSDYAGWFKYKGKGMRSAVDIDRAWWQMSPEQREAITQRIYTVGYQNWEESDGPIVGDSQSIMGRDSIDYELRQARGNALRALVEIWLNSGSLFNGEQMFMQVLEAAGVDAGSVTYDSPNAVKSAVFPVYLSVQNPLDTSNIPADVMSALEQASKRKRAKRSAGANADSWDKNTISGKQWMEVLRLDGGASAWTRIPDWVTETLQALGYDGVLDAGGKMGGPKHQVWIPFEETQVKSATGNRGTFDPNNPRIDYSISTQSEIDRVQAAMGALDRSPLSRIKIYEKMQEKFLRVMADNRETLAAMEGGDLSQVRRTQILQALGELDGIISTLPAEIRAKIGGYTQLAKVDPMDVFKGDQRVSEVRGMSGAIISAWMREGLNIGQAQKKTELPAGYRAERNLDPTRADRAIADVFIQRINRINEALEKFLRDEYNDAAVELFKRAKPQRSGAGEKPKGKLGATVHELFDTLKEATEWSAEQAQAWADGQWSRIEAGELNPYEQAHATLAAQVVPLFADWANADSTQRAAAVSMGKDILDRAYKGEQQRIIAQRTKRGYDRTDLSRDAGVTAEDDKARQEAVKRENSLPAKWEAAMLNLLNFDQVLSYIFGRESKIVTQIVNRQRKADNDKSDGINKLSDDWAALLTRLGGGTMQGQQLLFSLSRMDEKIDDVAYSQNQLMAITMMWMQPKGRQHMEGFMDSDGQPAGKWHYNQDFVNKAEKLLRPEAKVIREYLLKKYDEEYEAINKVYRKVYGLNLPKNQFYSPLVVESILAPAQAGIDPVTGGVFAAGANAPSALRSRGGAIAQPVFRDAVQTYFGHMLQMEHWKAYAEFNSEASALLGHRDTRNVIKGKAGEQAATVLNNWLAYYTQGGNKDAANHLALNQMINRVTGNFAAIALFGRVSTLALQVTQLGAAAAKMPVGAYLSRFGKLMSGQLGWLDALDSPYIQRRIKDMPPAVALAMQGLRSEKPSQIRNAAKWLGQHLSSFDGFFTAGTYAIVYDYQLAQAKQSGMTGQEAADFARVEAERTVDEVAQPTRAGARSIYELNNTNPVARAVWAFSSESRKNLGLVLYNAAKGTTADTGRALLYVLVINGMLAAVIRSAFRDLRDDDDDEIFDEKNWGANRMLAMLISEPLYGFPVVGEAIESAIFSAFGVYKPSGPLFDLAPAVPALKRMATEYPAQLMEGDVEWRDVARDVNRILGTAGLFNSTIAGAASISNLAKDAFEVTSANLPSDE